MEITHPKDLIAELPPGPLHFFPNPGNVGDNLITLATDQLLAQVPRELIRQNEHAPEPGALQPGSVLIYGGGGNLVPRYEHARAFFERYLETPHTLVLLPQTIRGNESLLARLQPHHHLFCRDRVSYQHARAAAPEAKIHLAHDMALSLRLDPKQPDFGLLPKNLSVARLRLSYLRKRLTGHASVAVESHSRAIHFLKLARSAQPFRAELNAFRGDSEAGGQTAPPDNADLSETLNPTSNDPLLGALACVAFLRRIAACEAVNTDRLHVAIAGALLDRRVRLYPNDYDKNLTVYQNSLRERYPKLDISAVMSDIVDESGRTVRAMIGSASAGLRASDNS